MTSKRAQTSAHHRSHGKRVSAEIGKMVIEKRNESRLTRAEVAKYIGVSTLILEAYETGARQIPMHHIYALSNFLDISPAKILRVLQPVKKK